jgi:hypothetical protein
MSMCPWRGTAGQFGFRVHFLDDRKQKYPLSGLCKPMCLGIPGRSPLSPPMIVSCEGSRDPALLMALGRGSRVGQRFSRRAIRLFFSRTIYSLLSSRRAWARSRSSQSTWAASANQPPATCSNAALILGSHAAVARCWAATPQRRYCSARESWRLCGRIPASHCSNSKKSRFLQYASQVGGCV